MDIARTVRQCCEWQEGNLGMGEADEKGIGEIRPVTGLA